MLISRGRNPSAGEVITQLFSNEELRGRVLTTLGLLLIVRLGIYIPMPGIDSCLLYTSPSPRDATLSRMPSSA